MLLRSGDHPSVRRRPCRVLAYALMEDCHATDASRVDTFARERQAMTAASTLQQAAVYRRAGVLLVRADSRTDAGVWVSDGPCRTIEPPFAPDAIFRAVDETLGHSRSIPHPRQDEWTTVPLELYRAAGVRRWSEFVRGSVTISVCRAGLHWTFIPWRKCGARDGFEPLTNAAIELDEPTPDAIAGAVLAALQRAS